MYNDIGGKIKRLAKATFIVEAISSVITGFVLFLESEDLLYLLILVGGPIVAWVSSWLLYGFGEIIDKLCEIAKNTAGAQSKVGATANSGKTVNTANQGNSAEASVPKTPVENSDKNEISEKKTESSQAEGEKLMLIYDGMTLAEKLSFALCLQTDEEMIAYLKGIDDADVKEMLEAPASKIRNLVKDYLKYC